MALQAPLHNLLMTVLPSSFHQIVFFIHIRTMLYTLAFLLCVTVGGSRLIEDEKKPSYLSAPVGESVLFTCDLDFPHDVIVPYTLNWNKEGKRVLSVQDGVLMFTQDGYAGRVSITVENGRASLNLTAIREPDHGWYECRLFFPNRTPTTRLNGTWFHLTVHGSDLLGVPPMNQTVVEGQTAKLECISKESTARVTWYKDGEQLSGIAALTGRAWVSPEGSLTITNAQPSDPGVYKCEVVSTTGQTQSATAYLNVHYKARVVYTPQEVFLPIGRPGSVDCHFTANPPLTKLKWEKDGFLFDPFNVPGVFSRRNGSLIFDKVEESHGGEYTCTPNNELGTAGPSASIHVVVQHPPIFTVTPHNMYLRKPGDTIHMSCDALDGESRPTIVWFRKDGSPLPAERAMISGGNLTIKNIKESDQGMYQCVASNEAATISADTELLIENSTPRGPHNLTGEAGNNFVTLTWRPGVMAVSAQYSVWVRAWDSPEWRTIRVSGSKATISSLDPGREYEFMVLSQNPNGDGMFSKPIRLTTKGIPIDPHTSTSPGLQKPLNPVFPCKRVKCKCPQPTPRCPDCAIFNPTRQNKTRQNATIPFSSGGASSPTQQHFNWIGIVKGGFQEIGTPKNVRIISNVEGYILQWDAPSKGIEFLDHYQIIRTDGPSGEQTLPLIETTKDTSLLVGDFEEGSIHHFIVKSITKDGSESLSENFVVHIPIYQKAEVFSLFIAALIGFLLATIILCVYINRIYVRTQIEQFKSPRR